MPPLVLSSPPPTSTLGSPGLTGAGGWLDTSWEETPELTFPTSARVYDKVRNDAQVTAVLRSRALPLLARQPRLNPNGADPRVVRFIADQLGLEVDAGEARRRLRPGEGVVWRDYRRHQLLAGVFGFMAHEKEYRVDTPAPRLAGLGLPRLAATLVELHPRMPRAISRLDVDEAGRLTGIRQPGTLNRPGQLGERILERRRLAYVAHDREGAAWWGRSLLRASYGHYLIKDLLLRLGPISVERSSMGFPVVTYEKGDPGAKREALEFARSIRAGEDAGGAIPNGMTAQLLGVTGTLKDELPLLKYHDESIGRGALAMFLNLGHDAGARSLGETFLAFYLMAEEATAAEVDDAATEDVIRDLVELNYGPDEPYPVLETGDVNIEEHATAEAVKALADAGLLDGDPELKAELRRRYRLPVAADPAPVAPGFDPGAPVAEDLDETDGPAPVAPSAGATGPGQDAPDAAVIEGAAAGLGVTPDELLKLVNAVAVLIRSGFLPGPALEAVGLNPIEHAGLLPITVQKPETPVAGLSSAELAARADRAGRVPTALEVARAVASATPATAPGPAPGTPAGRALRAARLAERAARMAEAAAAGDDA